MQNKSELAEQHAAGLAMRTVQARSASQTLAFSDTSSQWGATKGIGSMKNGSPSSQRSQYDLLGVKSRRERSCQAQTRGCSGVCCKQGAGKAMLGDWGGGRMELWWGSRWLGVHYGWWGGGWWQQSMVWGATALVPEMHGLYLMETALET